MMRFVPALLSVAVSLGTAFAYFSLLRVPAIRNHPPLYLAGFALGAAIAAVAVWRSARWPNITALALSAALLVLGAYFNFIFARLPAAGVVLKVGEAAPDFTLPDATGAATTLSTFRDQRPVVLVFYRGDW
jgi:alpha-beta hydrolase superfamily lysophospholipase